MKGRQFRIRKVVSLFILLVGSIVANWGYRYAEVFRSSDQAGVVRPYEDDLADLSKAHLFAAGWPQKFYLKVEYDDLPAYRQFSLKNLAINMFVWSIAIAGFVLYERRLQRLRKGKPSGSKRQLTIIDLLVCTGVLAAVFAYWRAIESGATAESAFGSEIAAKGGSIVLTASSPEVGIKILPESMRWRTNRVSEVTLNAPDSKVLAKTLALPYLARLNIGGGDYDLTLLNRLAAKPLLSSLRISGRRLDAQAVASIAAIKQLQALNLMRTNVTAKAVEHFSDMPRLQSLNLIHTDVRLADMGAPGFSKTLRTLYVPHPPAGKGDQLKLEGWPELLRLVCNEYDERINAEPVMLELKQLPRLRKVSLDAFQAFDLQLDQLPALSEFEALRSQPDTRTAAKEMVPVDLWIRNLSFGSLPALRTLSLHAPGVQQMRFSEPMAMRLELKCNPRQDVLQASQNGDIPTAQKQDWLNGWDKKAGPHQLSLASIRLDDVDLAPLADCDGIQWLDLGSSLIGTEQLRKLGGMKGLEELSVESGMDGQTVAWLVANLPSLRKLSCNPLWLRRLKLENNAVLEQLWADQEIPVFPVDALHIAALPNLKQAFDLPRELRYLHIDGAPALTGLTTRGPWPEKAVLKGVRDLTYFAAGGPRLDDSVVVSVLACEKLHSLTLAYSHVSTPMLAKIGALKNLTYLALSGSSVDDAVVSQWQPLASLSTLRLDDTAITDQAIGFILNCANLERLSLRNTHITAQGLARLSALSKLSRVDCGGADLSVEKLGALCGIQSLATLDLSDTQVTSQLLAVLQQKSPGTLRHLNLRNSQVASAALMQLARDRPALIFDLTDCDIDPNVLATLGGAERVTPPALDENDTQTILNDYAMQKAMKQYGGNDPRVSTSSQAALIKWQIEPRVFSPQALAANSTPAFAADPAAAFEQPSNVVFASPMSLPALIGYAIGGISKTVSEFATQGGNHVDEY